MSLRAMPGFLVCCALLGTGANAQQNITVVYPPPASPPQVVIVNTRPVEARADLQSPRQTTYLIAFKDSVVRLADQYWVSGNTLYYVTTDHVKMTAPLYSVDRALSARLNSEQAVWFFLPSGQVKSVAQAHLTRNVVGSVRKRCYCRSVSSARISPAARGTASRANSAGK